MSKLKPRQSLADTGRVTFDDVVAAYEHWQNHPYDYVKEVIGVKIVTKQQKGFLEEIGKLIKAKTKRNYGVTLTAEEKVYADKVGISVRAGKGRGKDALIAWIIIWLVDCHPDAKVPCTAPSETQLKTIVWAEVNKWLNNTNDKGEYCCAVKDTIKIQGEKIYSIRGIKKHGDQPLGYAFQKTALKNSEDSVEAKTMSGFHADFLVNIVTEADGVDDGTLNALKSTLIINRMNFMIMAFNATRRSGMAYKSQMDTKEKNNWIAVHFKGGVNEIVTIDHINKAIEDYGKDSNSYRVYIDGEYPSEETGSVIPFEWIEAAIERDITVDENLPLIFGTDPAGEGSDCTMTFKRRGGDLIGTFETNKVKDDDVGDEIIQQYNIEDAYEIIVLKNGVGIGYYKYIRKYVTRTNGFYEMDKPRNDRFLNMRAELWFKARDLFKDGLLKIRKFPGYEKFIAELNATRLVEEPKAKIQIESKKEIKKRLGRSPDRADAFIATLYRDLDFKGQTVNRDNLSRKQKNINEPTSWLGV